MEFVTNAFPESDSGRDKLIETMKIITTVAVNLENAITLSCDIHKKCGGLRQSSNANENTRINSQNFMKAQPQVTAGVLLSNLHELVEVLKNAQIRKDKRSRTLGDITKSEREKTFNGRKSMLSILANDIGSNGDEASQRKLKSEVYPAAVQFAALVGEKTLLDDTLKGFVELLGLYIFGRDTTAKYAKARTPIISRTNLTDVCIKIGLKQIKPVLDACVGVLSGQKVALDEPMYRVYPSGEEDAVGLTKTDADKITIQKWLMELPKNDLLSKFEGLGIIANENNHSEAAAAAEEEEEGSVYREKWFREEYGSDAKMKCSTDIGVRERTDSEGVIEDRFDGLILELRNLGSNSLDIFEWTPFAISAFDFILLINAQEEERPLLEKGMRAQRNFDSDFLGLTESGLFAEARKRPEEE